MSPDAPLASVVIPCRNEARHIESCLCSIAAQEPVDGGFEVLVVDGLSEDGTQEIIQQMGWEDSRVRLLKNPGRIVPLALNIGVQAARGQIILRMDVHTEYAPDYIRQCIQVLRETGADNVGGPARTKADSYWQRAIAAAYHSPFSVGGARFHQVDYEGYVDTVTYGCWYKDTLLRLGLFDEELVRNQDDELNLRLCRAGGKIWQSPRIKSWYKPRSSWWSLFKQYRQYGYWKVRVIQKHKLPASWRHLVPGAFVIILAGNIVLLPFMSWAPASLIALLATYLGFSLLASVTAARQAGWSLLPALPLVFAGYHFGYGLGFLRGLLDFVILRRRSSAKFVSLSR